MDPVGDQLRDAGGDRAPAQQRRHRPQDLQRPRVDRRVSGFTFGVHLFFCAANTIALSASNLFLQGTSQGRFIPKGRLISFIVVARILHLKGSTLFPAHPS